MTPVLWRRGLQEGTYTADSEVWSTTASTLGAWRQAASAPARAARVVAGKSAQGGPLNFAAAQRFLRCLAEIENH